MAVDRPVIFEKGSLSVDQLAAAFDAVPANVCFIDEDRVIRYVSRYSIFSGYSPDIIGTDVLDCHAEGTRARIMEMLDGFAAGTRDSDGHIAEKHGRKVRVVYHPVRAGDGAYLGCLEVAHWADDQP
jgi:hypothetical protein